MTKHDLKELAAMGAELGAAKAENEKLRGLLTTAWRLRPDQHYHEDHLQAEQKAWEVETAEVLNAADALSQQPEPTDTYTAVDMATAAAQGFRDGQAAVEQAPAQDERKTFEAWAKTQGDKWLIVGGLQWSAGTDDYASARTNAAWAAWQERAARAARPAQTEQQPVAWQLKLPDGRVTLEKAFPSWAEGGDGYEIQPLYAAPIAQTAPQGKFAMGDLVKKSAGSEWVGHVCGTYSTALTPEGYAVESEAHAGSVQIYPAKALELVPMAAKEA